MPKVERAHRHSLALFVSVVLVLAIGGVGLAASTSASRQAERIHRDDRMTLQRTLAGLTDQYVKFALKESYDFADARGWSLSPDDPSDREALDGFVTRSALVQLGAAVVGLDQKPLTLVAHDPGLPAPDDPGFAPLVRGLLSGQPGLSSVMHVSGVPVVALGVPIMDHGTPRAVLVTFFNAQTSPLERYTEALHYGRTDRGYVVDSAGVAVAASRGGVGRPVPRGPALRLMHKGKAGFREYHRDGVDWVVSFSPTGLGGWGVLTEQRAGEFFGPIRSSRIHVNIALLLILVVAATGLAILNHKRANAMSRINHQAFHDALTGLSNRARFQVRLEGALARARRHGHEVAVLFLDLDRFKMVNDSLGHDAGDQLLVGVVDRLRVLVREEDTFARMGGDEFTLLIESPHAAGDAVRVAQRLLDALDTPIIVGGHEIRLTASIGIAVCKGGCDTAEDLLRDADLAMYRAKDHGKARYEVFETSMGAAARAKLELENELRHAIEHDEFVVHYQPVVSLEQGDVIGAEALVRWNHPERGLLMPGDFLPLAEESGLGEILGRRILHTALAQLREWNELLPGSALQMNVNLGPGQVRRKSLVADVQHALRDSGVDPGRVVLELNETTIMEDAPAVAETLQRLGQLGVQLAIDDFGTGYASINWLKRLPVSSLKLDGVFVRDIDTNPDDAAIARSVVSLAHKLRITVTAEQVESAGQFIALRDMGCDNAQGFLFSSAIPATEFVRLLHSGMVLQPD